METAFEGFEELNKSNDIHFKHREWLKKYEGLHYSICEEGNHKIKWATKPQEYFDSKYKTEINLIKRLKYRTIIEFDEVEGEPDNPKKALDEVEALFRTKGWAYIKSTHNSRNSDYIWLEFNRDLEDEEVESFLCWICPKDSKIDLNFASSKKVFPILYSIHWKYSDERETPIEFFKGIKIPFDELNIPQSKKVKKTVIKKDGFKYKTYVKKPKQTKGNILFDRITQVQAFHDQNPFFYDKNKIWWAWNKTKFKYEKSDEVDILGVSYDDEGLDIITSKERTEIINSLKQVGRKNIPKNPPLSWVQFQDKIYDFKTGEKFEASPKYFVTNPLPYKIGKNDKTPKIDKLFLQWVGEDFSKTLYEVIAYASSSDQFMQRMIALVGGGSNGKGTFIKLLKRFLGRENICSSELKELSGNQFETATIYKKLTCIMGEVSYDDLKNTNQLKKLAGEDDIRFCFKGKTPFTDLSVTTLISATNSLPKTPDKTIGFYRKWLIIDFPNQFKGIKKELVENITEEEFESLSKKIFNILKELYKNQKFTNEGDFEQRMNRYEERSNPLQKFLENECLESIGERIELKVFSNSFNEYAKNNHLRIMSVRQISKILKDEGYELGIRSINNGENKSSKYFVLNLCFDKTNETNESSSHSIHGKTSESFVSSVSSVSFSHENSEKEEKKRDKVKDFFVKVKNNDLNFEGVVPNE